MKNLLIKEKIAKVVELKKLQQQVKTLRNQEQKINEEVMTQQIDAKRVTGLIQHVQQKLQLIT